MDPIANIAEQRKIADEIQSLFDALPDTTNPTDWYALLNLAQKGQRLAYLTQALDEWRSKGGFDPYTTR